MTYIILPIPQSCFFFLLKNISLIHVHVFTVTTLFGTTSYTGEQPIIEDGLNYGSMGEEAAHEDLTDLLAWPSYLLIYAVNF